ncbi:MAG: hypothetical protein IKV10_01355, partial [Alphaproteobacteria bacterium]|nr:hypothetical protein [Alphaproteobacteria bacterium]
PVTAAAALIVGCAMCCTKCSGNGSEQDSETPKKETLIDSLTQANRRLTDSLSVVNQRLDSCETARTKRCPCDNKPRTTTPRTTTPRTKTPRTTTPVQSKKDTVVVVIKHETPVVPAATEQHNNNIVTTGDNSTVVIGNNNTVIGSQATQAGREVAVAQDTVVVQKTPQVQYNATYYAKTTIIRRR